MKKLRPREVAQLGRAWRAPQPRGSLPQGQLPAPPAEGGVRGAARPHQGAESLAEQLAAGAEPLAGPVRRAQGAAPEHGHLADQDGQPLRGEAWGSGASGPRQPGAQPGHSGFLWAVVLKDYVQVTQRPRGSQRHLRGTSTVRGREHLSSDLCFSLGRVGGSARRPPMAPRFRAWRGVPLCASLRHPVQASR